MLHDIYPHLFDNHFKMVDDIRPNDLIFHFADNKLLLKNEDEHYSLPTVDELNMGDEAPFYLFSFNDSHCFWAHDIGNHLPAGFAYHDMGFLRTQVQKEIAWIGAVGSQLKEWYLQNRFCGKCGSTTRHKTDERALQCTQCQHIIFPRISPAIIVAITCNDKVLLAHNVNFPPNLYSLVAGYADVGESLEETIHREIKEEVGIEVTNIKYYKSQPWPFSGSMMIGFSAQADDMHPVRPDGIEITDAKWFKRGELPYRPNSGSIAAEMLEQFDKGEL